jgi:hypothetical protein
LHKFYWKIVVVDCVGAVDSPSFDVEHDGNDDSDLDSVAVE